MTEENLIQQNKVNQYVFTDSIAAAILIDGMAVAAFLAMPYVPILATIGVSKVLEATVTAETFTSIVQNTEPLVKISYAALSNVFPIVSSKTEYAFYCGLNIFSGFSTYITRDYTRDSFKEAGLQHYNGYLGGAIKYIENQVFSDLYNNKALSESVPKLAFKAIIGARNNYLYEECSGSVECKNNTYEFITKTETTEAAISATVIYSANLAYNAAMSHKIEQSVYSIPLSALGGYIIGKTVGFMLENIFLPNIESIHKISDVICEEYPSLIATKDKFSGYVEVMTNNIATISENIGYLYNSSMTFAFGEVNHQHDEI
jgi:hypothetical protein